MSFAPNESKNVICEEKTVTTNEALFDYFPLFSSFFLAGFNKVSSTVIPNSRGRLYKPNCSHSECSTFSAYKPDLISSFPTNGLFPVDSNTASLCFPFGIKPCFSSKAPLKPPNDFITTVTTFDGSRMYLAIFNFFEEIPLINLGKYTQRDFRTELTESSDEEDLKMAVKFSKVQTIYVPAVLGLVSKYPIPNVMSNILRSFFTVMEYGASPDELKEVIAFVMYSLQCPLFKDELRFYVPFIKDQITVKLHSSMGQKNSCFSFFTLINRISSDNLVHLFRLILLEKKLIIVSRQNHLLSKVIDCLVTLIYPLSWVHTLIPVLSADHLSYLQSFMPFIVGLPYDMIQIARPYLENNKELIVFDLEYDIIFNAEDINFANYVDEIEDVLDLINENEMRTFEEELDTLKRFVTKFGSNFSKEAKESINAEVKDLFLHAMIGILANFADFLTPKNNIPIFDRDHFLNTWPSKEQGFYETFLNTMNFNQFVLNYQAKDNNLFNKTAANLHKRESIKYTTNLLFTKVAEYEVKAQFPSRGTKYEIKPFFLGDDLSDNVAETINEKFGRININSLFSRKLLRIQSPTHSRKQQESQICLY